MLKELIYDKKYIEYSPTELGDNHTHIPLSTYMTMYKVDDDGDKYYQIHVVTPPKMEIKYDINTTVGVDFTVNIELEDVKDIKDANIEKLIESVNYGIDYKIHTTKSHHISEGIGPFLRDLKEALAISISHLINGYQPLENEGRYLLTTAILDYHEYMATLEPEKLDAVKQRDDIMGITHRLSGEYILRLSESLDVFANWYESTIDLPNPSSKSGKITEMRDVASKIDIQTER